MTSLDVLSSPIHFSPRRLCHVNLFISDLERTLNFYNRVCGLEIVLRQPSIGAGFVSNGNTNHDLGFITTTDGALIGEGGHTILAAGQASRPSLYHCGWEMEHEFDLVKANERAIAASFRINRTVRHLSTRSLYVFDADANIHEFYADVSKNWRQLYAEDKRVSGHWKPGELPPSMERLYQDNPEYRRVPDSAIHVMRFSHVALTVRSFDRMRLFFRNIAGLLEVFADETAGVAAFSTPGSHYPLALVLHHAGERDKAAYGLHHFALELEPGQPLGKVATRLTAAGYAPIKTIDLPHKEGLVIADPDGFRVELYHLRSRDIDFGALKRRGELEFGL